MTQRSGPLSGTKIVEFTGIGPGPFVTMMLSDLGAEVVRIDKQGGASINPMAGTPHEVDARGRRSIALDLKQPAAIEVALELLDGADAMLEGFRPGVMERLGLGPDVACARNKKLVYARMTGWGQTGPLAQAAGHDINYIAISGALHAIGVRERPAIPLNFLGDYGGALVMVIGMLAALFNARATGRGQVVDTAMSDAAVYLTTIFHAMGQAGVWREKRESNMADGGMPYYNVYRCADDEWISIGSIEPQFYAELVQKTGLPSRFAQSQNDPALWTEMRAELSKIFLSKPRQYWCEVMEGSNVCFAPVLKFSEAPKHPHNVARAAFVNVSGVVQPAPVPKFSVTPAQVQGPPPKPGEHSAAILADWGFDAAAIRKLEADGVIKPTGG
ncbi:MAG: CaiB/BaiF CoA-transferase family protein [Steroidobacteraceae bacterium]